MQNGLLAMKVLGIETSCDDTGIGLYDSERGLVAHRLASQIEIHKPYGGIVPELAARDHILKVLPSIDAVLTQAGLAKRDIGAISYTAGPGLVGALLVGATVANALAKALRIKAVGVHHMEGHLLSPMLADNKPDYPFVSLLVSGGHTMLVDVQSPGSYEILGQTRDDAAGEGFDKFASVLGLQYPGGPSIEKSAHHGVPDRFRFSRPMAHSDNLDFSFSGLKTQAVETASRLALDRQTVSDLAWAFQDAAVDTLIIKCRKALMQTGRKALVVAGGVGANQTLRERISDLVANAGGNAYFPSLDLCTDNGAMIAYAGYLRLESESSKGSKYAVYPRWALDSLPPLQCPQST